MKLILAILRDLDADPVTLALTDAQFRVTRTASTGGLLRRGVTTLMIGVEDEQVEAAIQVIKQSCSPASGNEKRAVIFVLPVERFEHI
ncbi:MAG: cyclic-di-AMP receptor [Anaerolineales bacterium]|nr:cyclic-di-AMP receptor [Anaerolineales bacterium]MCX7608359.1 cyclic-di-AMP receptor [Anaerolineales bacterium]MDW8227427.1 cyclic-di-AMP receptor [Anaerolineales bacterium]